jgi:hypothetical protein
MASHRHRGCRQNGAGRIFRLQPFVRSHPTALLTSTSSRPCCASDDVRTPSDRSHRRSHRTTPARCQARDRSEPRIARIAHTENPAARAKANALRHLGSPVTSATSSHPSSSSMSSVAGTRTARDGNTTPRMMVMFLWARQSARENRLSRAVRRCSRVMVGRHRITKPND